MQVAHLLIKYKPTSSEIILLHYQKEKIIRLPLIEKVIYFIRVRMHYQVQYPIVRMLKTLR